MPRNYQKKRIQKYTVEDLEKAVLAVKNGGMTYRAAEKQFGVPHANIYNRLKRRKSDIRRIGAGRPTELPPEIEYFLANFLITRSDMGSPCEKAEFRQLIKQYIDDNKLETRFRNGLPGEDWYFGFMQRHLNVASIVPEKLQNCDKTVINPFVVYDFYNKLKIAYVNHNIHEISCGFVFNACEVSVSDGLANESTSVLACVSASGNLLPPHIVFKGDTVQSEWISARAYPGTLYSSSLSGCIDEPCFYEWFTELFLPIVIKMREKDNLPVQTAILITNGHVSHTSRRITTAATANSIELVKFPSHFTERLHPLDRCMFEPLKEVCDRTLSDYVKEKTDKEPFSLLNFEFPNLLGYAWTKAMENIDIVKGFNQAGIFPLNSTKIPKHLFNPVDYTSYKREKQKQQAIFIEKQIISNEKPFKEKTDENACNIKMSDLYCAYDITPLKELDVELCDLDSSTCQPSTSKSGINSENKKKRKMEQNNKKIKISRKKGYTPEDLENAVHVVKNGIMSYRAASNLFGVPYGNIYNRIKGRVGKIGPLGKVGAGRPTELPAEIEYFLANFLVTRSDMGSPCKKAEFRELVKKYIDDNKLETRFRNGLPGEDWYNGFMQRHLNLTAIVPETLQKSGKTVINPFVVYDFYNKLKVAYVKHNIHEISRGFVFNADEISISGGLANESTSVIVCVSASGVLLPPHIIFKGNSVQPEWISAAAYPGTLYSSSLSGHVEEPCYYAWLTELFIPMVVQMREKDNLPVQTAILITNGHVSHTSARITKSATANNIELVKFPSHLTEQMHPLDKCVFEPLKAVCERTLSDYAKEDIDRKPLTFHNSEFPYVLGNAWTFIESSDIINGFTDSGIFPLDTLKIPSHLFNPIEFASYNRKKEKQHTFCEKKEMSKKVQFSEKTNENTCNIDMSDLYCAYDVTPLKELDIKCEIGTSNCEPSICNSDQNVKIQ